MAPSTCSEQSLATLVLCLAVSSARGAIDVQRAVVGYLLTLPRSQPGSWRHRRAVSSRWLLTYFAQSAWLVAPLTCSVQSLVTLALCLAVSSARGAIDVQRAVVGY